VRFRLTVWYSSLLLVFGVAFVVALNIAARLDQPDVVLLQGVRVNDVEWQPVRNGPGGTINGFQPVITPSIILKEAQDQINSGNLDRLQSWSLVAVVGLTLASGAGGYVLSGMMLRPVRDMTRVASEISATNLSQRINHQGPDDELKALADTFDSMIDRLETSFDRQRQFVQDASHELRTPLAAIRTNIEVTELDPEATNEEYRSLLETVKHQTERLTRLSEDLLLLSTNEGGLPLEPVSLRAIAAEVANELAPLAAARGVQVHVEEGADIEVDANPDHLYRSVLNLVDNGIKYSGQIGRVAIACVTAGGRGEISVRDTGPGIGSGDASRIFDRFYRVDRGRSRREGGNGLGLAIVRELVQGMGGTVRLASLPGQGSTFTISLPIAPADDKTAEAM
jgi:signal transduction histidine kinase